MFFIIVCGIVYGHVSQVVEKNRYALFDLSNQFWYYFFPHIFSLTTTGMIELHEFLMLLKSQHKEAQARIKELVEAPIMVLKSDTSKQYLPPTKGTK